MQKCKFNCLLAKAVDESLSFLGEPAKYSIYFHLECPFGLRREEMPKRPEVFAENLRASLRMGQYTLKD